MRRFIDLVESPVEDIHLVGGHKHYPMGVPAPTTDRARDLELFQQGHAFGDTDSRLIQSPKAQAKIYRAFSKTPHRFEIIFQNAAGEVKNTATDNQGVDRIAEDLRGRYRVGGSLPPLGVITRTPARSGS